MRAVKCHHIRCKCAERLAHCAGKEASVRIRIDRERCVGAGNCLVSAPTVFTLDEDGKAELLDPGSVDDDQLWTAAELCPTEAIVLESETGERLYP